MQCIHICDVAKTQGKTCLAQTYTFTLITLHEELFIIWLNVKSKEGITSIVVLHN